MSAGILKLSDFVTPQRTASAPNSRQLLAAHMARLQAKAADPATPPSLAAKYHRLVHKYRAAGGKRPGELRRPNAKDPEKLYQAVVAHIRRGIKEGVLTSSSPLVTREAIARYLKVPNHQVEQVFARLVREGLLLRKPNDGAHDTNRCRFFPGPGAGWAPTYWGLRNLDRWKQA